MTVTLDWLGTATFRVTIDDLVVYLDAYIDRVPSAPPVGLTTAEVGEADFVLVGHSHFDHLAGAEVIARNTGATIIGSHETARVMQEHEVPEGQLLASQGGEHHRLGPGVTVRVFPSLHSCVWIGGLGGGPADSIDTGHYGLCEEERAAARDTGALRPPDDADPELLEQLREHLAGCAGSSSHGGALAYVIETPEGSIFYQDTSGCWTGVLRDLRPDVAILAAAGRANIDGEPVQGSLAQFVSREAELMRPRTVILGHHDDWMPPSTPGMLDVAPIGELLSQVVPATELLEVGYLEGTPLFE